MANVITIDFETYWANDYTLTDMPTQAYILDERFETIGCGIAINDLAPVYVQGPQVPAAFSRLDWTDATVVAHNAIFDGTILERVYGIRPARYFCTMQAARAFVAPFVGSASLKKCADYFGFPPKGDALTQTKGKRLHQFSVQELKEMATYCKHDTWLAYQLYLKLSVQFPPSERELIDITIKKHTRPKLHLDRDLIELAIAAEDERRHNLLTTIDPAPQKAQTLLMSNQKFADELMRLGVAPPMKESPATGKETYAFAKKDVEFLALQEHADPDVQTLVAARLGTKSTLDRTRLEKFRRIAQRSDLIGVPLLYYGAGTGRFSGMDGLNMQNLSKKSALRSALIAPPGYKVVTADLSQIEARLLACLAGQHDLVKQFTNGDDVYSNFASRLYGYPVNADDNPDERFVGKCAILQLGYQAGHKKFWSSMTAFGATIAIHEAKDVVDKYRFTFRRIKDLWNFLQYDGLVALQNEGMTLRLGPVVISKDRIDLPNGMPIMYPHTRYDGEWDSVVYTSSRGKGKSFKNKLYGGMLTENICQALARIVLSGAEVRLARLGLLAVMNVHDELVYVVRDENVSAVSSALRKALTTPVSWMPELPLACTIGVGQSYKEAK